MRSPLIYMLPLALALSMGCKPRAPKTPDWVRSAPEGTITAFSGQASWIIQNQRFQSLLSVYPRADQILDLFLKRAHISPAQETGRVSFYLIGKPQRDPSGKGWQFEERCFLIQLGDFRDPRTLAAAVADAFPAEGSLQFQKQECPLHVVMDFNQVHIRAMIDPAGRIWVGDVYALNSLVTKGVLPPKHPINSAAEWTSGAAPFQGFLQPESLVQESITQLPADIASQIPRGVQGLAWSVTPGSGPHPLHMLELALTGTPEGINQVTPWLQRLVALMATMQGTSNQQPPEIMKEQKRVSLRARFTDDQLNTIMAKLGQPVLNLRSDKGKPAS